MILDKVTGLSTNVAISGDSWSWGEWYPIEGNDGSFIAGNGMHVSVVSHPSPQIYLHEYFKNIKIYHVGKDGADNNIQASFLYANKALFDFVIHYWTCPSRGLLNIWENDKNSSEVISDLTIEQYELKVEKYTTEALEVLNKIGVPILFVGGHVSLPDMLQYENCIPVVDRMTNLIEDNFVDHHTGKPYTKEVTNKIDWEGTARQNYSDSFSEEFISQCREKGSTTGGYTFSLNPKYFPDGGHGGRYLHKLTMDKVIDYIETNNMINTIVN